MMGFVAKDEISRWPLVGHLADRVGPARVMTYAAIAALVLAWPLFRLMTYRIGRLDKR